MPSFQQAIQSLGLDKRCRRFCRKCDGAIQARFDSLSDAIRHSFIEALAACSLADLANPKPFLGLLALLSPAEFKRFVEEFVRRAPLDSALAWQIIRLSDHSIADWFPERGTVLFQRKAHLHPGLAPLLLKAAVRPGSKTEDLLVLFDYFATVAQEYPLLRNAIPLWHAELDRRAKQRKAQAKMENAERLRCETERAARGQELNGIEYSGPAAILRALAHAPVSTPWDFPPNWARISDKGLRSLSQNLLHEALPRVASQATTRHWRSLAHRIRSSLNTLERSRDLSTSDYSTLAERLQAACDSRWSLTYFPHLWAEHALNETSSLPIDLQTRLLSKLMCIQRRSHWRTLRQTLCRHSDPPEAHSPYAKA